MKGKRIHEILSAVAKKKPESQDVLLEQIAQIKGVYVPQFYQPLYTEQGDFAALRALHPSAPARIEKRVVADFEHLPYPEEFVVPYVEVIHDRVMAEIMRGCTRGCRFCQAGMIYRPVRERSPQILKEQIARLADSTGYEEISLSSLSSGDYGQIFPLIRDLMADYQGCGVSVSLPSLRLDSFSVELAEEIQRAGRQGSHLLQRLEPRGCGCDQQNVSEQDLKDAVQGPSRPVVPY